MNTNILTRTGRAVHAHNGATLVNPRSATLNDGRTLCGRYTSRVRSAGGAALSCQRCAALVLAGVSRA